MKKVLIFTYYWPPSGGPGVQRFLKFCKYLKEFGWDPIVVTVKNGSYPSLDHSLTEEVPKDLSVYPTPTFEPFELYNALRGKKGKSVGVGMMGIKDSKSLFQRVSMYVRANYFIPDGRKGWIPYAIKQGKQLLNEHDIDAILTTGPPHSTHLIGRALSKQFNVPWLADFRDPWTNIYYNQFLPRTRSSTQQDQDLENDVLKHADGLVVVSDGLKEEFEDRAKKTRVIYNGYDAVDMAVSNALEPQSNFVLSYIGNLKPNQNATEVWQALADLVRQQEDFARDFRLNLTGNADPFVLESIRNAGLSDHLDLGSYVPHREATRLMQVSGMLLFMIPQSQNNRLILTGKLFEYLASGTPMLSVGPVQGNAAHIIAEAGRDVMMDYEDRVAISAQILKYYRAWQENRKIGFRFELNEAVTKYSRKGQTEALGQFLDEISSR